jgi:hypothetical protein
MSKQRSVCVWKDRMRGARELRKERDGDRYNTVLDLKSIQDISFRSSSSCTYYTAEM